MTIDVANINQEAQGLHALTDDELDQVNGGIIPVLLGVLGFSVGVLAGMIIHDTMHGFGGNGENALPALGT